MLVGERMSHPVITVNPDMPIQDALNLMQKEHVRRFPVVDKRGSLKGIVSEKDLLNASPSEVTSLSIWEMHHLLSKITIDEIMTCEVVTISEDSTLEEAALIMADKKIGGLPVVRNGNVVGIITETDLFKLFLELFGGRDPGVRISVTVPNLPGELAKLTKAVFDVGGNIVALGTFAGESTQNREVVLKVNQVNVETIRKAVEPVVEQITDIREPGLI